MRRVFLGTPDGFRVAVETAPLGYVPKWDGGKWVLVREGDALR